MGLSNAARGIWDFAFEPGVAPEGAVNDSINVLRSAFNATIGQVVKTASNGAEKTTATVKNMAKNVLSWPNSEFVPLVGNTVKVAIALPNDAIDLAGSTIGGMTEAISDSSIKAVDSIDYAVLAAQELYNSIGTAWFLKRSKIWTKLVRGSSALATALPHMAAKVARWPGMALKWMRGKIGGKVNQSHDYIRRLTNIVPEAGYEPFGERSAPTPPPANNDAEVAETPAAPEEPTAAAG